jgi:hypothetical protein
LVGGFAQGLGVVQDDVDTGPGGARQNFELVDGGRIKDVLGPWPPSGIVARSTAK